MRRLYSLAVVFLAAAPICCAQAKRPMTFEDMMAMKRLGDTAVSPDGNRKEVGEERKGKL